MTLCPVISQSGYEFHAGFASHFALSAGLFLLSWGNTLLSQVNYKAIEKTEAGRGPWSWGLWSCLGQALLKAGPTARGCSGSVRAWPRPRTQIAQLLWAVFQCLTSLLGNRFSRPFNWNFSSSTLPLGQTLRGAWLHLHLCSGICLWWAWWGSWWTISRAEVVWSPLWIAPVLDYGELKLMTSFNTKSQIMATGNTFK